MGRYTDSPYNQEVHLFLFEGHWIWFLSLWSWREKGGLGSNWSSSLSLCILRVSEGGGEGYSLLSHFSSLFIPSHTNLIFLKSTKMLERLNVNGICLMNLIELSKMTFVM